MPFQKLPRSFYRRDNVVLVARELLGKVLCTQINHIFTSGIIVETEAYSGHNDLACHACMHGRTARTDVMFGEPGHAYVYLCYGIHHLFNVVTNDSGFADAILIRALEPVDGKENMLERRNINSFTPALTNGPGKLSQALGITTQRYGTDLLGDVIWIEDHDIIIPETEIHASPRIGVDYAGKDAKKPWRFTIHDSKWISK